MYRSSCLGSLTAQRISVCSDLSRQRLLLPVDSDLFLAFSTALFSIESPFTYAGEPALAILHRTLSNSPTEVFLSFRACLATPFFCLSRCLDSLPAKWIAFPAKSTDLRS
jgi:hypothetical protein